MSFLNKSVYFVLLLLCFVLVALIFNLVSKLFSLHHSLAYVYANFAVISLVLFKYDTIKDFDGLRVALRQIENYHIPQDTKPQPLNHI